MRLAISAITKYMLGAVMVGAMLFLPAYTFDYPNAWLFLGLLFIPMLVIGIALLVKMPKLLEKRLSAKEKIGTQRGVVGLSALTFVLGFVLSALDFRFSWSYVPSWVVIVASLLFLLGYLAYAEIMRENAYLSRTVEIQENQKVIDTGLYRIVRHPMYLATLLMFLTIPLILGSFCGIIPFLLYPVVIVLRIINEEKLLSRELQGYNEYKTRTKYRLIPFVW